MAGESRTGESKAVGAALRRSGAAVGTAILAFALACGAPVAAHAHNYLISSTPSAGEVLTTLPDEFVITTNDALLDLGDNAGGFALQVMDSKGLYYGDGCVKVDGPSMSAPAVLGEAGDYTVRWQIVSIDGHTVSDEFTFTWQPDGATGSATDPARGSTTAPVCGTPAGDEPAEDSGETDEPSEDTPVMDAPGEVTTQGGSDDPGSTDLLWIGGAIVAVAIAAGATVLTVTRKKK